MECCTNQTDRIPSLPTAVWSENGANTATEQSTVLGREEAYLSTPSHSGRISLGKCLRFNQFIPTDNKYVRLVGRPDHLLSIPGLSQITGLWQNSKNSHGCGTKIRDYEKNV